MITVYDHPLSPYSQKVKIALLEKGVPFEAPLPTNLGSGEVPSDFATASPRGEVPALVDEDVQIFDSTIILEYIEDRWPEPALLGMSPLSRARSRMIEEAMDTHYEAINWGLGELEFFGRAPGEVGERLRTSAAEETANWQVWLTDQLGAAPWFEGDHFGWADLAVIPYLNGSLGFGLGPDPESPLGQWQARCNARPSVAKVAADAAAMAMGDNEAGMAAVRELLEQGLFKREYRDHRLEWMIRGGGLDVVRDGLARDNIRFTEPFTG